MTKFLNTNIDFEKQEPFIERIILVIIVLFSVGTVVGVMGYLGKKTLDRPLEIEISRLAETKTENSGSVKSGKIEVTKDLAEKIMGKLLGSYDPNEANYFANDLNGDGQDDMIIAANSNDPTIYIVTPIDKDGNYKSIASLKLSSQNADYRADRLPSVYSKEYITDIDGDGQKEIIMGTGAGGAYTTATGIFKIDWKAGKISWLKAKKADGSVVNTAFLQGASVMHKAGFSFKDIDGDNKLEIVEDDGDYVGPNDESTDTDKELSDEKNWKWQTNVYKWDGALFGYNKDLSRVMVHFAGSSIRDFMLLDFNGDGKNEIAMTESMPTQADSISRDVRLSVFTYNSKSDSLRKVYEDSNPEINGTGLDLYLINKGSISGGKKEQLLVGKTIAGSRHSFGWYLLDERYKPVAFDEASVGDRDKAVASYGDVQVNGADFSTNGLIVETGRVFLDNDPNCCASGKEVHFYYQMKNGKLYYIKDTAESLSLNKPAVSPAATDWKIYRDEANGFEIKYPADFLVKKDKDASGTVDFLIGVIGVDPELAGKPLVELTPQIKDSYDTSLTVHVSEGDNALSGCLKKYRGVKPGDLTDTKKIGSVTFYKESLSQGLGDDKDANTYLLSEVTSYRAVYQNRCYQISVYDFFHTASGGLGSEKEKLNEKMEIYDEILSTFKFIPMLTKRF